MVEYNGDRARLGAITDGETKSPSHGGKRMYKDTVALSMDSCAVTLSEESQNPSAKPAHPKYAG